MIQLFCKIQFGDFDNRSDNLYPLLGIPCGVPPVTDCGCVEGILAGKTVERLCGESVDEEGEYWCPLCKFTSQYYLTTVKHVKSHRNGKLPEHLNQQCSAKRASEDV